jgi:hypothetical protein
MAPSKRLLWLSAAAERVNDSTLQIHSAFIVHVSRDFTAEFLEPRIINSCLHHHQAGYF